MEGNESGGSNGPSTVTLEPGAVVMQPYPLRCVTIIGGGLSAAQFSQDLWGGQIDLKKGESEVWTLNHGGFVYRHDLLFNMRDFTQCGSFVLGRNYLDIYRDHPVPVVTARWIKELPCTREFPWQRAIDELQSLYFSTSTAYMIAFALLCGVKELRLYGCDFNYPGKSDIEAGRACFEFWLGRAFDRGVKVFVAEHSTLMDVWYRARKCGPQGNGLLYGLHDYAPIIKTDGYKIKLVGFEEASGALGASDDPRRD